MKYVIIETRENITCLLSVVKEEERCLAEEKGKSIRLLHISAKKSYASIDINIRNKNYK